MNHPNILTYFFALGFLGLWFLLARYDKWNKISGIGFFFFLLLHFIVVIGEPAGPLKYMRFSRDLFLISIFGLVFRILKHNKIGLVLAILLGFWISYQLMNIDFEPRWMSGSFDELSRQGELLILPADPGSVARLQKAVKPFGGKIRPAFHPKVKGTTLDDFLIVDLPDSTAAQKDVVLTRLQRDSVIRYGEFNDIIQVHPEEAENRYESTERYALTNDPLVVDQWAFYALRYEELYKILIQNRRRIKRRVKVAVLDTGIEGRHEDLTVHIDPKNHRATDPVGHGTHCAGIIGAVTNNHKGVASMAFYEDMVELIPVKVLNSSGMGSQVGVINGMIRAIDEGADILSLSLGAPSDHPRQKAYAAAVRYALDHNAVVVVSAGNSSRKASAYSPANVEGVICVTAIDKDHQLAHFSNYLDDEIRLGIAAPGVGILSTFRDGEYRPLSGTSMSAPFVSGAAAVLKAFDPQLSAPEIYQLLYETALPSVQENRSGRILQPHAALEKLLAVHDAL